MRDGKTIAASTMIEQLHKRLSPEIALAYYYFNHEEKDFIDFKQILSCIARQSADTPVGIETARQVWVNRNQGAMTTQRIRVY